MATSEGEPSQFQLFTSQPCIRDKIFKNGPSKICGRQRLKYLKGYGCLSQISLGPFLNNFVQYKHTALAIKQIIDVCFKDRQGKCIELPNMVQHEKITPASITFNLIKSL